MSPDVLFLLLRELELGSRGRVLGDGDAGSDGPSFDPVPGSDPLTAGAWMPTTQPRLRPDGGEPVDFFAVLRDQDLLVHHPYDSFVTSVEAFVEQAARDKDVLGIKVAMYRTSGPESPIACALRSGSSVRQAGRCARGAESTR